MACLSMVDTDGKLFGGKSSKYEAVGGTNTGTCQHGEHGLRNHRHIDHHQITHLHAMPHQNPRQPGHLQTGVWKVNFMDTLHLQTRGKSEILKYQFIKTTESVH